MSSLALLSTKAYDQTSVVASTNVLFTADYSSLVSCQAVWTSTTLSASLTLQYSLDNASWNDFTTATVILNTSSNVYWNIHSSTLATGWVDALYWRVNVAYTSGTFTTLKVYFGTISR